MISREHGQFTEILQKQLNSYMLNPLTCNPRQNKYQLSEYRNIQNLNCWTSPKARIGQRLSV